MEGLYVLAIVAVIALVAIVAIIFGREFRLNSKRGNREDAVYISGSTTEETENTTRMV